MKQQKVTPPFTPRDVTHQFDGPVESLPSTEVEDTEPNTAPPREFVPKDANQTTTVIGSSDGIHGSFQGEAQS